MKNPTPANPAMTDNLLFEHFATLATAPDGIARLRELILQLAVQGKLGTQDAGDETVQKLVERIRKEKDQSVDAGKIKHGKHLEKIKVIPYDVPVSWQWCQLGEISEIIMGNSPPGDTYNTYGDGVPLINGPTEFSKSPLGKTIVSQYTTQPTKFCKENDLLICVRGATTGRTNIAGCDACVGRGVAVIRSPSIQSYLNLFILTKAQQILSMGTGSTFPSISQNDLLTIPVPLPPLAEQHRIVAKVDRLMALCDELDARQQQERAGCLRLGTASLAGLQNATPPEEFGRQWAQVCDAFDLILDCPKNVAVLRQTILNLAVHGRLMQQMPGDEPAEKLLERIRSEKERLVKDGEIKREKLLEPVLDDEIPFVIPHSWKWVRINDAAKIVEYGTSEKAMSSPTAFGKDAVPVFRMNNIQNGKVIHENLKYLPNSIEGLPHLYLQNNDILINRTNSYELVGKAGIFKGVDDKFTFASYLIRISFFPQLVNPDFVNITLNGSYFRTSQIEPQVTQQCGQANFSGSKIKNALIPLPPLPEQHRIVAKVDALMMLCDALESRLKERAGVQGRLAGAVGKQVTGG